MTLNPNPARRTATAPLRNAITRTRKDWSGPIDPMTGPMKRDPRWRKVILHALDGTEAFIETWTPEDILAIDRWGSSIWRYWQACAFRSTGDPDLRQYFNGEHLVKLYTPNQLRCVIPPGTWIPNPPEDTQDEPVGQPTSVPHLRLVAGGRG